VWWELYNNSFIANCPQSVPVKELLKSVNIWRRYRQKYGRTNAVQRAVCQCAAAATAPIYRHVNRRCADVRRCSVCSHPSHHRLCSGQYDNAFLFEATCEYDKNILQILNISAEILHMIAKMLSPLDPLPLDPTPPSGPHYRLALPYSPFLPFSSFWICQWSTTIRNTQ